jgi:RNA polymerase sigma-70 factor (family 1)
MKIIDDNDRDLLLLISEGDEGAFKQLFEKYNGRLHTYLLKVTKSRESSEEIVMDVFLKLWHSRSILTEINNFSSFLFKVARNKAFDFLRLASKDKILRELIWTEIEAADNSSSDDKLYLDELASQLDQVVSKLPYKRQFVYRLSREQHMTYDQIATHLNISKATVKNHILDALSFIRLHISANSDLIILIVIFF